MGKFFSYVFFVFIKPKPTMQKIVDDPDKKLMTIYAIIWDNLLLILITAVVIIFRQNVWSPNNLISIEISILHSFIILLIINAILLIIACIHYLYLKKINDIEPSFFYSYFILSSTLLLVFVVEICHVVLSIKNNFFWHISETLLITSPIWLGYSVYGVIMYINEIPSYYLSIFLLHIISLLLFTFYYIIRVLF